MIFSFEHPMIITFVGELVPIAVDYVMLLFFFDAGGVLRSRAKTLPSVFPDLFLFVSCHEKRREKELKKFRRDTLHRLAGAREIDSEIDLTN